MNKDIYEIRPLTELFRATIVDVHDPERAGRVRVRCLPIHGREGESDWCPVVLPPYFYTALYEGRQCWVTFRDGDPNFPIVTGMALRHDGKYTSPLFREWSEGPYKTQLNDATQHASNQFDNEDHRAVKGHNHPPYYDPYLHLFHFPQGGRFGVNEEPGEQGMFWVDRIGNGYRMVGDPANPKDPHKETRQGGIFSAAQLDSRSTLRTREGWRSLMEFFATHAQRLVFRVKDRDGEEEILLENRNERGDKSGTLTLSNLIKRNELIRTIPGKEIGLEQVLDDRNPQRSSQRLWDWAGSEIFMDSAPGKQKIRVSVSGGESTVWDNIQGSWITRDRFRNEIKLFSGGVHTNASTEFRVNANTTIYMQANLNATLRGMLNATLEGGVRADVKAPLVGLGMAPSLGVAYMGSLVTTAVGPGAVTMGSLTVSTTP